MIRAFADGRLVDNLLVDNWPGMKQVSTTLLQLLNSHEVNEIVYLTDSLL